MLKLIKIDYRIWDHGPYERNPSVGNHFALHSFDTQEECDGYIWEERCQTAESYGEFDEEEQDWSDFVEDNSDYICVDYDPTNPIHVEHTGFEDERPEHVEWLEKERVRKLKEEFKKVNSSIIDFENQIEVLKGLRDRLTYRRAELIVELSNESK